MRKEKKAAQEKHLGISKIVQSAEEISFIIEKGC
jgi:hypothetical protein